MRVMLGACEWTHLFFTADMQSMGENDTNIPIAMYLCMGQSNG